MAPNLNFTSVHRRLCIDDCIGATSFNREELDHFITSVNSFHPALKYTWENSESWIAFLDIKVWFDGNGLSTSVHNKLTDSYSYLLHSSFHPSHVKNSIPFCQFLRLHCLCSDNSDFSNKSEEMCLFSRSVVILILLSTRLNTVLKTSQKEKNERIPFTLTYHPHTLAAKNIILKNFKKLKVSSHQLNSINTGLALLLKTILRHWNYFLPSVATDGKDGNGLKLQLFHVLMQCS